MNNNTFPMAVFTGIRYVPTLLRTTDKLFLPIDPPNYIYSHFKHVSGILAKEGQRGVTISKIKTINTLIEQANNITKNPEKLITDADFEEEEFDALIEQYSNHLRNALSFSSMPYNSILPMPKGMIVNLVT